MFAQYSPLFTSGLRLLADPPSDPAPAPPPRSANPFKRRKRTLDSVPRGVGPHSAHSAHSSAASFSGVVRTADSPDSPFVFTFAPRRRRSSAAPEHSFLSFDLADARSLRRKDTVSTRRLTLASPEMPAAPLDRVSVSPPAPAPALRRTSREALHLPSPKPAPSTRPPPTPTHRPALSSSSLSSSSLSPYDARSPPASLSYPAAPRHRASRSAPALLPSPTPSSPLLSPVLASLLAEPLEPLSPLDPDRSYLAFSPPPVHASPPPPPPHGQQCAPAPRAPLGLHARPSVGSTTSVRTRLLNRSAALAALEGRARSVSPGVGVGVRPRAGTAASNFMSMSDDEEGDEGEVGEEGGGAGAEGEEGRLAAVLGEEEDVVIPRAAKGDVDVARRSRGTIESLLLSPLANFMDLSDGECGSGRWRSFVEIAS